MFPSTDLISIVPFKIAEAPILPRPSHAYDIPGGGARSCTVAPPFALQAPSGRSLVDSSSVALQS